MAQTRGEYEEIDDTEVDAESPVTQSLMFRMRDQYYGALCDTTSSAPDDERLSLPGRAKTSETNTSRRLAPNGSGGVEWRDGVYLGPWIYDATADAPIGGVGKQITVDTEEWDSSLYPENVTFGYGYGERISNIDSDQTYRAHLMVDADDDEIWWGNIVKMEASGSDIVVSLETVAVSGITNPGDYTVTLVSGAGFTRLIKVQETSNTFAEILARLQSGKVQIRCVAETNDGADASRAVCTLDGWSAV